MIVASGRAPALEGERPRHRIDLFRSGAAAPPLLAFVMGIGQTARGGLAR
jgi:hypothetical protein